MRGKTASNQQQYVLSPAELLGFPIHIKLQSWAFFSSTYPLQIDFLDENAVLGSCCACAPRSLSTLFSLEQGESQKSNLFFVRRDSLKLVKLNIYKMSGRDIETIVLCSYNFIALLNTTFSDLYLRPTYIILLHIIVLRQGQGGTLVSLI